MVSPQSKVSCDINLEKSEGENLIYQYFFSFSERWIPFMNHKLNQNNRCTYYG